MYSRAQNYSDEEGLFNVRTIDFLWKTVPIMIMRLRQEPEPNGAYQHVIDNQIFKYFLRVD